MEIRNIPNIFMNRSFLDDLDFLKVNMDPIFINNKT